MKNSPIRRRMMSILAMPTVLTVVIAFASADYPSASATYPDDYQENIRYETPVQPMREIYSYSVLQDTSGPNLVSDNLSESVSAVNQHDAEMIAKAIWGEARGVDSIAEQAAIAWCILNRVDAVGYGMGNSVEYVLTFPCQFSGYDESFPVTDEFYDLAVDVITRWNSEKSGAQDVGRVLPSDYLWFKGDGAHNHFRNTYDDEDSTWDWSMRNPYSD